MRIRDYLLRIIAGALCIVLAAAIVTLVFMNQRRNRVRAEELKTRQEEIKREEKEKLQKASDLYIDLATLCQDIRIVCWGDEEMRGQEELSLPKALEETANESLFTEGKDAFSGILDLDEQTPLDVETVNMGVSDEGMREILARAGVNELQVSQWTVIPADTEPKNISMRDDVSSTPLRFAEQRRDLFGPVTILDVEGSLVVGEGEYDEDHPRFAFVRDEEGESIAAGSGTEIRIASAEEYLGYIPVIFFDGDQADTAYSAGAAKSVDAFVENVESLADRYSEESGNYVVICTTDEDSDVDLAFIEAFGDKYLRCDTYAEDMSEEEFQALAKKVFEKLDKQGCFDKEKSAAAKAVEELNELSVKKEH